MFIVHPLRDKANIPRTIRFSSALFDRLTEIASQEGVSFNYLILQCCEFALQNLEESSHSKSSS